MVKTNPVHRYSELKRLDDFENVAPSIVSKKTEKSLAPSVACSNFSGQSSQVSKPETITRLAVDEIEALLKQKLSGAARFFEILKNYCESLYV